MYAQINFIAPVIGCMFYVKPLSKDLLVPSVLNDNQFELFRFIVITGIIVFKVIDFRQQVQFKFNESYLYVEKFMMDVNRKLFDYIRYRMSANFLETWYIIFQNCAYLILPMYLLMCEYQRYLTFQVSPTTEFDFSNWESVQAPNNSQLIDGETGQQMDETTMLKTILE